MRVVFDTNIYVSAFAIPGGKAEEAYLQAVHGRFELFTSVAILTETAGVLQTKFDWAENRARQAIQEISQTATVLRPRPILHLKMSRTIASLNVRWPQTPSGSSPGIDISLGLDDMRRARSSRWPTFSPNSTSRAMQAEG